MTETTGPIAPPPSQVSYGRPTNAASADQTSRLTPLVSPASTSAVTDSQQAATLLGTATAQLSALRNQAGVAATNGDVATLRQLAERAVAIGVAAGASAESLAGDITSALAATQRGQPVASASARGSTGGPATTQPPNPSASKQPTGLSALGLDPSIIAALFDPPDPATSTTALDQPPSAGPLSGLASGLEAITSLNVRAGSIITQARGLVAAMNTAVSAAGPTRAATTADGASDALSLNSLAGLLDQAESSMSARIFAAAQQIGAQRIGGQQIGGRPVAVQPTTDTANLSTSAPSPALDLKT